MRLMLLESAMKINSTRGFNSVVHLAIFSLAFSYPGHKVQWFKSKNNCAQIIGHQLNHCTKINSAIIGDMNQFKFCKQ